MFISKHLQSAQRQILLVINESAERSLSHRVSLYNPLLACSETLPQPPNLRLN